MPRGEQDDFSRQLATKKAAILDQQRQAVIGEKQRQQQDQLNQQRAAAETNRRLELAQRELRGPIDQITREMDDPNLLRLFHELFRRYGGGTQKVWKRKGIFGKEQEIWKPLPFSLERTRPYVLSVPDLSWNHPLPNNVIRTSDQQYFLEGGSLNLELNRRTFRFHFWRPDRVSVRATNEETSDWFEGTFTYAQLKAGLLNAVAAFDLGQKNLYTDIGLKYDHAHIDTDTY